MFKTNILTSKRKREDLFTPLVGPVQTGVWYRYWTRQAGRCEDDLWSITVDPRSPPEGARVPMMSTYMDANKIETRDRKSGHLEKKQEGPNLVIDLYF